MAFHNDLLEQALHLALRDRKRPKQASLRRAVSTAYYALFHLLVSEAVGSWKVKYQRPSLARAFDHGRMKSASLKCKSANTDLRAVASAFVELQQSRHLTDYDNAKMWTRVETIELIDMAAGAFKDWTAVRGQRMAQDFLLSLLIDRK